MDIAIYTEEEGKAILIWISDEHIIERGNLF